MRFAIFSNSAPPDWLIVSFSTLSTLTALRITTLTKSIIAHLLASKSGSPPATSLQLPASVTASLTPHESTALVSALAFILTSICRTAASTHTAHISSATILEELRQLGLQADVAKGFVTAFEKSREALVEWCREEMQFRESKLVSTDWKVFYEMATGGWTGSSDGSAEAASAEAASASDDSNLSVFLSLNVSRHKQPVTVVDMHMDLEQFDTLKMELEGVRAMMDQVEADK